MKRFLVAAILVAAGAGAVQAQELTSRSVSPEFQCSHFVPPSSDAPSDSSYGKHLAAQYSTANGE